MPSKYPSVTAKSKGAAPKPANFPKGKGLPANDNKMGLVKSPIGKLPKKLLPRRGFGNPLASSVEALLEVYKDGQRIEAALSDGSAVLPKTQILDFSKFNISYCTGCEGSFDAILANDTCCAAVGSNSPFVGQTSITSTSARGIFRLYQRPSGPPFGKQKVAGISVKSGVPLPQPVFPPFPQPVPGAPASPFFFPMEMPVASPWAQPKPTVFEAPKPGDEPSKQPEAKPQPEKNPKPNSWVKTSFGSVFVLPPLLPGVPIIRVNVPPGLPPVVPPGVVVEPSPTPGRPPIAAYTGQFGRSEPPSNKRTVEKKAKLRGMGAAIWAGVNTTTEVFDFIVAMHDSIPKGKHKLSGKASKRQVLEYMMTNIEPWKHIEFGSAVANYVNMQIGDFAAALGGKQIKRVSQELGIITGLDRALRQHGDAIGDIDPESNDNWTDIIPTLDIDPETGLISIVGPLGVLNLGKHKTLKSVKRPNERK